MGPDRALAELPQGSGSGCLASLLPDLHWRGPAGAHVSLSRCIPDCVWLVQVRGGQGQLGPGNQSPWV